MILHTITPQELIFQQQDEHFSQQTNCMWNGIPLIVEQEGNKCKVIRVMSSNPADYLKNEIQPGNFIGLSDIEM